MATVNYTTEKASVNGFSMEYLKFGSGSRILVILPGLSVQSVIPFAPAIVRQYERFSNDFTVYLFDRRADVPPVYTVRDMALDTVSVMKSLGLDRISLFGTSQGGMMSMVIASEYPELVEKLVLVSTAMHVDEGRFSVIREWITFAEKKDSEGLYLSLGEKVYPKEFFEQNKDAFSMFATTVTDAELKKFIILANGIKGFDVRQKADNIRCPVLVAADEYDAVIQGKPYEEIRKHLQKNDRLEVRFFNGFGHALYDTAPGFGKCMLDFLRVYN